MKTQKWMIGLAGILLFASCKQNPSNQDVKMAGDKAIRVEIRPAGKTVPDSTLEYSGAVIPSVNVPLSFKTMGTVTGILVDEGDFVKKGQVLARLDHTSFESSYNAALASQKQAKDAYERLKKVYEKGSLPEIQWQEVLTKLEQAQAAEEIARRNLDNCTLRAPANGVIGARKLEVGANAAPGVTVLNLMDIKEVFVKISVPENEISKIKKGQHALVTIPALGDEDFEATVQKIGVSANAISKTYEVKLKVGNAALEIKPGMVCDVKLNIGAQKETVVVPFNSVLKEGDKTLVFVVDKNTQTVQKTEVKTGAFINNDIEIISGLSAGDLVVTVGQQKLRNHQRVEL